MLESVFQVVPVLLQGARNNLYGWGCPLYCVEPSWSILLLTYFFGLLCGISLSLLTIWTLWTYLALPASSSAPARPERQSHRVSRHSALAGYVDASQSSWR